MNEQWTRWEPIAHLGNTYFLEHAHDGIRGLEILLVDQTVNKRILILFPYTMISYTVSGSVDASIEMSKTCTKNHASFCNNWSFFQVMNSNYIARLMEESATIVEIYDPRHFVILTTNARIDVVASYEPDVSSITMNLVTKTLLYKEMIIPYIIRTLPTAQIILYEPDTKENTEQTLNIAINYEILPDTTFLQKIEKDLQNSEIPLACFLTDMHTLSQNERDAIVNNGIVWRK